VLLYGRHCRTENFAAFAHCFRSGVDGSGSRAGNS
jgi:hypothetical protein